MGALLFLAFIYFFLHWHRKITVSGASNNATVTIANIKAGAAYIHIIDAVLLPKLA